jgi:hypothetical protein
MEYLTTYRTYLSEATSNDTCDPSLGGQNKVYTLAIRYFAILFRLW